MTPYSRQLLAWLLVFPSILSAAETQPLADRYLSVTAENDIYAPRGQDRHYTNGIRIAYGPGTGSSERAWYSPLGSLITARDNTDPDVRFEFAFGQNIYTPEYYANGTTLQWDRPFAGWLYGELSATSYQPGTAELLAVNIGMIGPAALARQSQNLIHDLVNDPELIGWDKQLRNEPGLLVRYRRSWFVPLSATDTWQTDVVPGFGINFGNVFTDAAAGVSLRFGNHLAQADVPSRIPPDLSAAGSYYPIRKGRFDWMIYSTLQGRAVAQNIFLDGNTFRESAAVDKKTFTHDLVAGFVLGFGQFSTPLLVAFNLTFRSKEFELQRGTDSFGSITINAQY